ncbi:sialidase-2 isoform X3 [Anopheles sinensis]|uniref:Sialidase-2 isoform X3 n=1 Tax=Anopheles sinensis TaxID=74873 RepID=A0A084WQS7_ANOSI|nr:sialidase-2 isoform X3 [Anopheles sinensis]
MAATHRADIYRTQHTVRSVPASGAARQEVALSVVFPSAGRPQRLIRNKGVRPRPSCWSICIICIRGREPGNQTGSTHHRHDAVQCAVKEVGGFKRLVLHFS